MPSLSAYRLTWVSLTWDVGYLFMAAPAKGTQVMPHILYEHIRKSIYIYRERGYYMLSTCWLFRIKMILLDLILTILLVSVLNQIGNEIIGYPSFLREGLFFI